MCGIAGIISNNPNKSRFLKTALDLQRHRGPDGEGTYEGDNVGLAHSRLSILDLEGGRQPMESPRSVVVFNGEIYNYKELKQQLESKGFTFQTHSDTEVVLHGFEAWGESLFPKLRGMFAIGIYEKGAATLTLARDPFGIKPLHYFQGGGAFAFSSEIKPLATAFAQNLSLNFDTLSAFLHLQYIPSPNSVYNEIKKVMAGTSLKVSPQGNIIKHAQFYSPQPLTLRQKRTDLSYEEVLKKTREVLLESVQAHLLADVEVGTFLSGGIDSTLVTMLAAELSPRKINTFSVGFEEAEFDESHYSTHAAKAIGTQHRQMSLKTISEDDVRQMVSAHGEPFGDSSGIPTYFVSKLAGSQVKVALTGDGADEMFFGYDRYAAWISKTARFSEHSAFKKAYVRFMRKFRPSRYGPMSGEPHFRSWSKSIETFPIQTLSEIFGQANLFNTNAILRESEAWFNEHTAFSVMDAARRAEIRYYMQEDILAKVDIASMRNSLETRPPFVDLRVWEWVRQIPEAYLFDHGHQKPFYGKRILKDLLKPTFDASFIDRPKMGFGIPLNSWINKGNLRSAYEAAVFSSESKLKDILDQKKLQKWHREYIENGPGALSSQWVLLVLNMWLEQRNTVRL
jgi:asparagine synthase (glutamine-hydrolysing)